MNTHMDTFNEHDVLHKLKHYLPAQAPLKDFVHHNTLHAFQDLDFHQALHRAAKLFGYKTSLSIDEYRSLYAAKRIREDILKQIIGQRKGPEKLEEWLHKAIHQPHKGNRRSRIGSLRANWKKHYHIDLDSMVHPILFRILCSYLDQGISIWNFPIRQKSFLAALHELEKISLSSFFRTKQVKTLFLSQSYSLKSILDTLVGNESLYEHYLFDQQFSHPGWSGLVNAVETLPESLLDARSLSLHDLIVFELLLEMDSLYYQFGNKWEPMQSWLSEAPVYLFAETPSTELSQILSIWQEAYEWSYYDQVLAGLEQEPHPADRQAKRTSFQALLCIDDRECSLRRYLEEFDHECETFGTPGFFGIDSFFQPEGGKYYTKICPVPVTPTHLIKETGSPHKRPKDYYLDKHAHSFHSGWLIAQTLGFWAALRLVLSIFRPTLTPAAASSFRHMDNNAQLTIENNDPTAQENGLQIGYSVSEMAQRVENILKSIGLADGFAPIIYIVGHGASSVNNPHYAAYDCGACSGRAGSVNARVFAHMGNHTEVRAILRDNGIYIPDTTQFIGCLHDTTRDEIEFFDENSLLPENQLHHQKNKRAFDKALDYNAKERSRRFDSVNSNLSPHKVHERVRQRSVALFETRPELNHATNALTIVGRRSLSRTLFLDRRSFLNSYNYRLDPDGIYLLSILKAAVPVSGGINLEYFFSKVDNNQLGAGTKLPHNVMGLIGVANGMDGDLRPGLPSQMVEVHEPIRMLFIVEQDPGVVLTVLRQSPPTMQWFANNWVHLVAVHPETFALYVFTNGAFTPYQPLTTHVDNIADTTLIVDSEQKIQPVYIISDN
ncbi:DUF2309 domain-containing protein [Spirosoma sp. SC4-14]|uniref:YbcC family protein n=1 Tax=Spirosoma sp. SC4-14 TaxID=3128900 RepID=UPI0030CEF2E6